MAQSVWTGGSHHTGLAALPHENIQVTFEYFNQKYTLLQHITGDCKDLGMERMNNAIKYLCQSGAFIKGEKT